MDKNVSDIGHASISLALSGRRETENARRVHQVGRLYTHDPV